MEVQIEETLNCVWIVDDDLIARMLIRKKLEKEAFCANISEFKDGKEALDAYKSINTSTDKPSLILLDLNMPVMDGWTFLDAIKSSDKIDPLTFPPVAILTSSIDKEDQNKAKSYRNIISFLKKPLDLVTLKGDLKSFQD